MSSEHPVIGGALIFFPTESTAKAEKILPPNLSPNPRSRSRVTLKFNCSPYFGYVLMLILLLLPVQISSPVTSAYHKERPIVDNILVCSPPSICSCIFLFFFEPILTHFHHDSCKASNHLTPNSEGRVFLS